MAKVSALEEILKRKRLKPTILMEEMKQLMTIEHCPGAICVPYVSSLSSY
jgi:hypothetical protein